MVTKDTPMPSETGYRKPQVHSSNRELTGEKLQLLIQEWDSSNHSQFMKR